MRSGRALGKGELIYAMAITVALVAFFAVTTLSGTYSPERQVATANSVLVACAGYWLSYWIAITIHELGHLIGGHLAGFRFQGLVIGGWGVTKADGRLHFSRVGLMPKGGIAIMTPIGTNDLIPRFRKFTVAGPLASVLYSSLLGMVLLRVELTPAPVSLLEICVVAFFGSSISILPGTLIARTVRGFRTDALLLRELRKPGPEQRRIVAFTLNRQEMGLGIRARDWTEQYVQWMLDPADGSPSEVGARYLSYYRLVDAGNIREGLRELDRAFELSEGKAKTMGHLAEVVSWERVFAAAWWSRDAERARELMPADAPKSELAIGTYHGALCSQCILAHDAEGARSHWSMATTAHEATVRLFGTRSATDAAWFDDMEQRVREIEQCAEA